MNLLGCAFAAWLGLLVVAILNGGIREKLLVPAFGELTGHLVSTILLSGMIFAFTGVILPWLGPASSQDAWLVGLIWLCLTLAFEFLGGHFIAHAPWKRLLADYNVARGRIWILVLLVTLLSPPLLFRWGW
jgi:hypothetical protein